MPASLSLPNNDLQMNIEFNKNEDLLKLSLSDMSRKIEKIYEGGGKKAIEKQHAQSKWTARERIEFLIDKTHPLLNWVLLPVTKCMKSKVDARQEAQ